MRDWRLTLQRRAEQRRYEKMRQRISELELRVIALEARLDDPQTATRAAQIVQQFVKQQLIL